jgi:hypothetical protein
MIDLPKWHKKGLIYCPNGDGFFKTHATRPVPYQLNDEVLRIFFCSRDDDDRMLPTFIDVEAGNPSNVIHVEQNPVMSLGGPGRFDDSDNIHLYYSGWKRRRVVSFEVSIGLAVWNVEQNRYERAFDGPLVGQSRDNPLLACCPYVVHDGNKFRMWYCLGTDWKFIQDRPEPIYTVYYAESKDGLDWKLDQKPVIQYKYDGEVLSVPWVTRTQQGFIMWYSTRGSSSVDEKCYMAGVATSHDGITWERRDSEVGIEKSANGWDSEMICYPAIYNYGDKTYMFYSGNGVGRGGIGYAVADRKLDIIDF